VELQAIVVQDRIGELQRTASELRAGGPTSISGPIAGLRRGLGRRLVIIGIALIDGARPGGSRSVASPLS
jgi:hypothetical protein